MLMRKEGNSDLDFFTVFESYVVEQFMSTHILIGKVDFTVTHIARLFDEMKIHHLPIVDENRKVVGIITANDMLRIWSSLLEEGTMTINKRLEIRDYMTKNPISCQPETTLAQAIRLFEQESFHALPVLVDGELVGIFTANDLISFVNGLLKS